MFRFLFCCFSLNLSRSSEIVSSCFITMRRNISKMRTAALLNLWHLKANRMLMWRIKQKNGFITGHVILLFLVHLSFKLTKCDNLVCKNWNKEALRTQIEITVKQRPFNKQVVIFFFYFYKEKIYQERGEECVCMNVVVYNDFQITLGAKRVQRKNNPSLVTDFCTFFWTHKIGFRAGRYNVPVSKDIDNHSTWTLQAIRGHFTLSAYIWHIKTRSW